MLLTRLGGVEVRDTTDSSCMRRIVLWLVLAVLIAAYCVIDNPIVKAAIVISLSLGATCVAGRAARGRKASKANGTYVLIVVALGLWAAGWVGWEGTILATGAP